MNSIEQISMQLEEEGKQFNTNRNATTFLENMKLPIHKWFRYSAGFSAEWVETIINKFNVNSKSDFHVFDPFTGSGTVLVASDKAGVVGIGTESHPFVSKMTRAKMLWDSDVCDFESFSLEVLNEAQSTAGDILDYSELILKCYPEETLLQLDSLKKVLLKREEKESPQYQLTWLALVSILRTCSTAGTAQWQYVLPKNKKQNAKIPFQAFFNQVQQMKNDMTYYQSTVGGVNSKLYQEDIRNRTSVPDNWADLIITSPPYANNYDYADATRLELSFFNEISGWGDLQGTIREHLVRSCTQHVSKLKKDTFEILKSAELESIYDEIFEVCTKLDIEKDSHGGKKNYHTMIATYFLDLANTWIELRRICKSGSDVCFVIGDSAPYGIYVPVDEWLGKLAIAAGFKEYSFEKARDRNTKWKNRKHTVPLKEGYLWVKG